MAFARDSAEVVLLDTDPWNWTVDEVTSTLCDPESSWSTFVGPLSLPDPTSFRIALCENLITGPILLTEVDHASLRDDLGLKALGVRGSIMLLIKHLRARSQRYSDHIHAEAVNTPLPGYGRLSNAAQESNYGSPSNGSPRYHQQGGTAATTKLLPSPISSDYVRQPLRTPSVSEGNRNRNRPDIQNMQNPQNLALRAFDLPRPNLQVLMPKDIPEESYYSENANSVVHLEEGRGSSETKEIETSADATSKHDASSARNSNEPNLVSRRGETSVTDNTGRKRRKLVLQPTGASLVNRHSSIDSEESVNTQSQTSLGNDIHGEHHLDSRTPNDLGSSARWSDHTLLAATSPHLKTKEYAKAASMEGFDQAEAVKSYFDDQGRRKMEPPLISQSAHGYYDPANKDVWSSQNLIDSSRSPLRSPLNVEGNSDSKARNKRDLRVIRDPTQAYLGLKSLPVDEIFYGDIAFGQKLQSKVQCEVPQSSDGQDRSDTFMFSSGGMYGNGQRIYVNAQIKFFLQSSENRVFRHKGRRFATVIPYRSRIVKNNQPLSLTLFANVSTGIVATKENRLKWIGLADDLHFTSGEQEDQESTTDHLDLTPSLGDTLADDWDFLEKWKYKVGGNDLLPVYGESGSEGEYDLATWQEMEEDEGKLERTGEQAKSSKLSDPQVLEAMEHATCQMVEEWSLKKLPGLKFKAWRIWTKSRRERNKRVQIRFLTEEIDKLDKRLAKIQKEMMDELWTSAKQVKQQCRSMEESIFRREECRWKISVLESRKMPTRLPKSEKMLKPTKAQISTESLGKDEDEIQSDMSPLESSDDDWNDFIDYGDVDEPLIYNIERDATNSDDEGASDILIQDTIESDESPRSSPLALKNRASSLSGAVETVEIVADVPSLKSVLQNEREVEIKDAELAAHLKDSSSSVSRYENLRGPTSFVPLSPRTQEPEVIDLTLRLDSSSSEATLSEAERDYAIRTPPLIKSEEDHFRRIRKVMAEFKHPPMTSSVINLESDSAESVSEQSGSTLPPEVLPGFSEVEKIAKLGSNLLEERRDRKRLLIWVIHRRTPEQRNSALNRTRAVSLQANRQSIWAGLKTLKAHGLRIRGEDLNESNTILQLTGWFIVWTVICVPKKDKGILKQHVETTLAHEDGFEPFWLFMIECLKYYEQLPVKEVISVSSMPNKLTSVKRKQKILLDDSDASEPSFPTPHKKRKWAVPESQDALNMRMNAQQRVLERDQRQRALKLRFEKMGPRGADALDKVVNIGKFENQDFVLLNPKIGESIQPHQLEGVQFMWREIVTDNALPQGCLLAQTMGLGKTMQVITLLVTIAEAAKSPNENVRSQVPKALQESRTLILCPPSLIDNWFDEFLTWAPSPMTDNVGDVRKVTSSMRLQERLYEIRAWSDEGGVLLIGYTTLRDMITNKANKKGETALSEMDHQQMEEILLERPCLVVADEAHALKNSDTSTAQVANRFRSKSRIALTGSPLSNNLEEYYSLIEWVAPGFLGDLVEFRARYIEPIQNGLWQDSQHWEVRKSLKMLQVLKIDLDPKIHRANISTLEERLQGMTEFVIRVPLTELQQKAYDIYVDTMIGVAMKDDQKKTSSVWAWLGILQLLCNHPQCFKDRLTGRGSNDKDSTRAQKRLRTAGDGLTAFDEELALSEDESVYTIGISQALIENQIALFATITEPLDSVLLAHKMQVLMRILEFSEGAGDNVLVFSQSLLTLDYVERLLKKSSRSYSRLDGKTKMSSRQQLTKDFNKQSFGICLISTKAGGQGLNFYGANRVVILDASFNPMYEEQAIGRAYRIGQKKHVYVYRLTAGGTFEDLLHNQSLFKRQLAIRVVDKKHPKRHAIKGVKQYLSKPEVQKQEDIKAFAKDDPLVLGRILASEDTYVFQKQKREDFSSNIFRNSIIRSIETSKTFRQEDHVELTPEEMNEATQLLKDEQLRRTNLQAYLAMMKTREKVPEKVQSDLHKSEMLTLNQSPRVSPTSQNYLLSTNNSVHEDPEVANPNQELPSTVAVDHGTRPKASQADPASLIQLCEPMEGVETQKLASNSRGGSLVPILPTIHSNHPGTATNPASPRSTIDAVRDEINDIVVGITDDAGMGNDALSPGETTPVGLKISTPQHQGRVGTPPTSTPVNSYDYAAFPIFKNLLEREGHRG